MRGVTILLVAGGPVFGRRAPDSHLLKMQVSRLRRHLTSDLKVVVVSSVELTDPPPPSVSMVKASEWFGDGGVAAAGAAAAPPGRLVISPVEIRLSKELVEMAAAARHSTFWACSSGNRLRLLADGNGFAMRVGYGLPVAWSGVVSLAADAVAGLVQHGGGKEKWSLSERLDHLIEVGHRFRVRAVPDGSAERILRWGCGSKAAALKGVASNHTETGALP